MSRHHRALLIGAIGSRNGTVRPCSCTFPVASTLGCSSVAQVILLRNAAISSPILLRASTHPLSVSIEEKPLANGERTGSLPGWRRCSILRRDASATRTRRGIGCSGPPWGDLSSACTHKHTLGYNLSSPAATSSSSIPRESALWRRGRLYAPIAVGRLNAKLDADLKSPRKKVHRIGPCLCCPGVFGWAAGGRLCSIFRPTVAGHRCDRETMADPQTVRDKLFLRPPDISISRLLLVIIVSSGCVSFGWGFFLQNSRLR